MYLCMYFIYKIKQLSGNCLNICIEFGRQPERVKNPCYRLTKYDDIGTIRTTFRRMFILVGKGEPFDRNYGSL